MTLLLYRGRSQFISYQAFRRVMEESKLNPHPNVLPVIGVSEPLFPFCIMSPWTPDDDITLHIQMNPGADRLVLVCTHQPGGL